MEIGLAALGAATILVVLAVLLRRRVHLTITTKGISLRIEPPSGGSLAVGPPSATARVNSAS